MDMRMLIKCLLQVQPTLRPNCDQILEMPIVIKRIRKYFSGREGEFMLNPDVNAGDTIDGALRTLNDSELLRTIKLSKNVFKLSLPEPTY